MRTKDVSGPNSNSWLGGRSEAGEYVSVNLGAGINDSEQRVVVRPACSPESHVVHHHDEAAPTTKPPTTRSRKLHTTDCLDPVVRNAPDSRPFGGHRMRSLITRTQRGCMFATCGSDFASTQSGGVIVPVVSGVNPPPLAL